MTDSPETDAVTDSGGNQRNAPIRFTYSPAPSNQSAPSGRSQAAVLVSSEEGDWSTGICDCCQDKKQCTYTAHTNTDPDRTVKHGGGSVMLCKSHRESVVRCLVVKVQTLSASLWSSGCFAFCCCPCFACRTTRKFGQCLCLPLLDALGCVRPIAMSIRVSLRQRYGIRGSLCSDCLCSTFCLPCVWCQMATEMERRKLPTVLKMTKVKREKVSDGEEAAAAEAGGPERSYAELVAHLNPIAQPLASRKLSKKLYKCVKKGRKPGKVLHVSASRLSAAKGKNIRRGVKEVQKFINKGEKGIVVLAGDTLPIDVYSHLPVMCEDRNLPYAYIPSKVVSGTKHPDLGSSAGSKRPTCVILIKPHADYQDAYDECLDEVSHLPKPL
ncbi:hypothetical protein CCH79_00011878 [Gambusia affinis]|uniref:Ribosomal protein eL8/eL30/eS12/Gadd45 domain-containing protein n=1 Tax=Gambusia affinis TaxID=33528 RepID=A0A315VQ17_GAMAF|nr:hypothetical protein CCH79_00011878 [Gambusia affinis]